MKRSVYEFEQKVRAMWEDKESVSAYPFGRHYGGTISKPFAIDENSIIYLVYYGHVEKKDYKYIFKDDYYDGVDRMEIALLYEYHFDMGEERVIYKALDMTNAYRQSHIPAKYKTQMRIFRNDKGDLFIKLTDVKPGWGKRDSVYILQPMRYIEYLEEGYSRRMEVRFCGWHKVYADGIYAPNVRGVHSFEKQVDDQTVFETINNMTFDFNDPYRVPHPL